MDNSFSKQFYIARIDTLDGSSDHLIEHIDMETVNTMKRQAIHPKPCSDLPPRPLVEQLLGFFYPIHYRLGMDLETVMCQGRIARKQAAILWLIHSSGTADGWLRRKDIEISLVAWFEMSNSNVSKLLRELAGPSLQLIRQEESPESGREKIVCLTAAGRSFVDDMIKAAIDHLSTQLTQTSLEELRAGIRFLAGISSPARPSMAAVPE